MGDGVRGRCFGVDGGRRGVVMMLAVLLVRVCVNLEAAESLWSVWSGPHNRRRRVSVCLHLYVCREGVVGGVFGVANPSMSRRQPPNPPPLPPSPPHPQFQLNTHPPTPVVPLVATATSQHCGPLRTPPFITTLPFFLYTPA